MDYDLQTNLTVDSDAIVSYSASSSRIVQEVILTIFFIIGMCADVAIFYTIFCYKRIRTVPNILLANWAIADLLCLMVTPSSYRLLSVMTRTSLSHEFLCFLEEYGSTFHVTTNLFIIVALIDWFIAAHFGRLSEKFRDNYIVILGALWIFAIVYANIFTGICLHYYSLMFHQTFSLLISYSLVLLLVIGLQASRVIQIIRRVHINSPTLNLTLASAYTFCSILSLINILCSAFFWSQQILEIITIVTMFCSSLVNLTLLYSFNKEFRVCFFLAIKCSANEYEDSISDFNNPIRSTHNTNNHVAFRASQELLTNTD